MKKTDEITDPGLEQVKPLSTQDGGVFQVLVEEGLNGSAAPFRLRDGSFRTGHGLQPGVGWQDLTALAYQTE